MMPNTATECVTTLTDSPCRQRVGEGEPDTEQHERRPDREEAGQRARSARGHPQEADGEREVERREMLRVLRPPNSEGSDTMTWTIAIANERRVAAARPPPARRGAASARRRIAAVRSGTGSAGAMRTSRCSEVGVAGERCAQVAHVGEVSPERRCRPLAALSPSRDAERRVCARACNPCRDSRSHSVPSSVPTGMGDDELATFAGRMDELTR